jgi:hypothetical protein
MNTMRVGVTVLGLMLGLSGFANSPRAQQNTTPVRPPVGADGLPSMAPDLPPAQKEKQEKLQNDDRQKQLVADTEKLLQLATELHTDVAKTNKNVLSVDVIKRADEIEKLAHSVKVKMRG